MDVLKGAYPKADYPPGNATNINRIADVITDLTFKCAARRTVRALAAKGNPVCGPKPKPKPLTLILPLTS